MNELLLDKGVRAGEGIHDTKSPTGMTYDEAIEEGKLDEYIASTVKSQYEKHQEAYQQQQVTQQWETEKAAFATEHPDVDMNAFIEKHEYHNFDQCLLMDTVETGGGLDKMLADAKAEGVNEGFKQAAANLRKDGGGDTELNTQTGTTKSDVDAEFKMLTAEQIGNLSNEELDAYTKRVQGLMRDGKIPKSDLIMEMT